MGKQRSHLTEKLLQLSLEIICLLTGEDCSVITKSGECLAGSSELTEESDYRKKILEVTNRIIELLMGEVPIRCYDVAVYLSMEEREYLEGHCELYKAAMMEEEPPLTPPGDLHDDDQLSPMKEEPLRRSHSSTPQKPHPSRIIKQEALSYKMGERPLHAASSKPSTQTKEEGEPLPPSSISHHSLSTPSPDLPHTHLPAAQEKSALPHSDLSGHHTPYTPIYMEDKKLSHEEHPPHSDLSGHHTSYTPIFMEDKKLSHEEHLPHSDLSGGHTSYTPIYMEDKKLPREEHPPRSDLSGRHTPYTPIYAEDKKLPHEEHLPHSDLSGGHTSYTPIYAEDKMLSCEEHLCFDPSSHHEASKGEPVSCEEHPPPINTAAHHALPTSTLKEEPVTCEERHLPHPVISVQYFPYTYIYMKDKTPSCEEHLPRFGPAGHHEASNIKEMPVLCEEHPPPINTSVHHILPTSHIKDEPSMYEEEHLPPINTTAHHTLPTFPPIKEEPSMYEEEHLPSFAPSGHHKASHIKQEPVSCEEHPPPSYTTAHHTLPPSPPINEEPSIYEEEHLSHNHSSGQEKASSVRREGSWRYGPLVVLDPPIGQIINEDKPFGCCGCGKSFETNAELIKHRSIHTGEMPYSCPECGRSFLYKSQMLTHQRVHTGERPFSCSICGKTFIKNAYLVTHQRSHTGEKPFSCSECGKGFVTSALLQAHQRLHTGDKAFHCSECGKSYLTKTRLTRHRRYHSKVKPFSCAECSKAFSKKSDLVRHQRIHTGERPYCCTQCGKRFIQRSNLLLHERIHTGQRPYCCTQCGKGFHCKTLLAKHQSSHSQKPLSPGSL